MSWNDLALVVLAVGGLATLALSMLRDILLKVVEVIQAWRAVRRELRTPSSDGNNHGPDPQR